jgi:hypothetical protein
MTGVRMTACSSTDYDWKTIERGRNEKRHLHHARRRRVPRHHVVLVTRHRPRDKK